MDKVEEVLKIDVITNVLNVMLILFENFLFCYIVDYFCNDKKINKKRFLIVFLLITINSPIFFNFFSSMWINCLINDAMIFLVIGTAYRKSLKKALISMFSTSLIIISVTMIVQNNFYNIFIGRCLTENKHFYLFCIVVFFRVVVAILQLKYIDKMCKLYQYILDEDNYLFVFITILFVWSYAFCLSDSYILGLNNETMKSILNVWFVLFVIFALLYIIRIASKSREINRLNDDLKDNNNQLRKIKHDYGAQISYFYGLCLMDRYNDLEIALKDVIDRTKYSNKIKRSDSILQLAVETAIKSNDIKVTIEEKADLSKLIIPEIELFRVLSNIITNAVEAMEGQGNIFAKAYQLEEKVIILIQNDGPEIPKDALLNIFKTGFTTKDNTEKGHGFGLSIVKELVERYDGQINVASSKELTEFRIVFKCNK